MRLVKGVQVDRWAEGESGMDGGWWVGVAAWFM